MNQESREFSAFDQINMDLALATINFKQPTLRKLKSNRDRRQYGNGKPTKNVIGGLRQKKNVTLWNNSVPFTAYNPEMSTFVVETTKTNL